MNLREKFGRNININDDIRERYKALQKEFIFTSNLDSKKTRDYKYIFMLGLALGYKNKTKIQVKDPIGLLNVNSFDDNDLWTIAAIAVEEKNDLDVINNAPEMKRIASEYAHGGLGLLEDLIDDYGSDESLELVIEKQAREVLELFEKK